MSTVDTSTWNPDPDLNESLEGIPLNSEARIDQTWQALRILMAAGGLHGLQLVTFEGATASADGKQGLVPAPEAGDQDKVLKGDGTWDALSASDIPNLDASKITSGTIDIARLPAGALERLVTVADQTARYALTVADVQLGDTVKQLDTGAMYIVADTSKLGQAGGYVEFTAGSATSVPWSGVTDKPSTFPPSSHSHGNLTNDGKIGSTANLPLITTTSGKVTTGSFGSAANTFCQGNDSRLSDARTPTAHAHGSITNDGKLGTASRVVVTDGSKVIGVSSITTTKLGYLTDVTSNIQGQIDGKADSATTLSGYGITDAKIASGTITLGSNTITPLTPASSLDAGKLTGTASVDITGNAATATAFSASKAVTLTGAVTGTASSTGGWTVSTLWRSCVVGQNTSSSSNPWYKVATRLANGATTTYNITFYVENATTNYKNSGILKVSVSTNSSKIITLSNVKFTWLVNDGFDLEDFVLVCPSEAESTIELWTKVAVGYQRRRFVVISEGYSNSVARVWTLLDAISAGQSASITTTGTQIPSTLAGSVSIAEASADLASGSILSIAKGGTGSSTKNFVDLSTAQTVAGIKTFSATKTVIDGDIARSANTGELCLSGGTNAATYASGATLSLYGSSRSTNPGIFILSASTSSTAYARMIGQPNGTLTWNGQNIQTSSDERLKTSLSQVPDAVLDAWEDVQWGQFQYLSAINCKGESARLHLGLIAQRLKAVFEDRGLDACEYGILCYEEEEDLWMVRYTEALAMEAACQRRRADRLEARIKALEERLK